MWDLPRPGLEPVCPALAGRFSTAAPPGKPESFIHYIKWTISVWKFKSFSSGEYFCTVYLIKFSPFSLFSSKTLIFQLFYYILKISPILILKIVSYPYFMNAVSHFLKIFSFLFLIFLLLPTFFPFPLIWIFFFSPCLFWSLLFMVKTFSKND